MKKLNMFRNFDWESFSKNKTFACTGVKYSENKQMIVAEIVVLTDGTDYGEEGVTNLFEKFRVAIPGTTASDLSNYASFVNQKCSIMNIQKISVYGDYSNQLSITAQIQLLKG